MGALTPLLACAPSGATSTSVGRPAPDVAGTTEKCKTCDVPPPGAGLTTCTVYVPAAARSPVASCALNEPELLKVVGRPVPLTSTSLAESKPLPETEIAVEAVEPATTLRGLTDFSTGVGFTTFNATVFDRPPPGGFRFGAGGFSTAMLTGPVVAISEGSRVTVNCVLEIKFVVRFAPSTVAIDTLVPGTPTKFDPRIVMVAEDSAATVVGEIDEICGTGSAFGVITSVTVLEVPPPGAGENTVTFTVPEMGISLGLTRVVN